MAPSHGTRIVPMLVSIPKIHLITAAPTSDRSIRLRKDFQLTFSAARSFVFDFELQEEKALEAMAPHIRLYCLLDNAYPSVEQKVPAFSTMWDNEMDRLAEAGEESAEMNEAPLEEWMTNVSPPSRSSKSISN
jgi:hypothetical protein